MKTKIKMVSFILIASLALGLISGCSSTGFNDTELMRPPRATGEKAEIQTIIENTAGGDYTLKYPQSGDYRSAIITEELDSTGRESAVAFYRTSGETTSINILFMNETNGKWKAVQSFKNPNSEVDKIFIGDIDNDGIKEVIIGWTSFVSGANQITYYKTLGESVEEYTIEDTYSQMTMADLTGDGLKDLILLSLAGEDKKTACAKLYCYAPNGSFGIKSNIDTNASVTKYSKIQVGRIDNVKEAIFIDGTTVNNNELLSEVIYYDPGTGMLTDPLNENRDGAVSNVTTRKTSAVCRDIDNDGIMEVPVENVMKVDSLQEGEILCSIIDWYKMDANSSFTKCCSSVANFTDGYYFILPESWENMVAAFNNNAARTIKFYAIENADENNTAVEQTAEQPTAVNIQEPASKPETDAERDEKVKNDAPVQAGAGDLLMTIQVFTEKDWAAEKSAKVSEGFAEITDVSGLVYTVKIENGEAQKLKITIDEVINNFRLINNT